MSNEDLKSSAAKSVADGGDIRQKVRDITLAAIKERKFDFAGMREVMTQVSEGITVGAEQRGTEMKQTLSQAFAGLDDAFTKSAHATQLALAELTSKTREFFDIKVTATPENLKKMESDFLGVLKSSAERAGGQVKAEMSDLAAHVARTGTDTGAAVAKAMSEFSTRMAASGHETTAASLEAARKMSERFAQVASGFLAGMSDALAGKEPSKKK